MGLQNIQRADLDWKSLTFSYTKTDANIRYHFKDGKWSAGELSSSETFEIGIAAPCLHYGQEAFEGLKVFETVDGRVVAFRPDENAHRLQHTSTRLSIPHVDDVMFLDAVDKVVKANARFVPPFGTGATMYLRPLSIGVGQRVGLGPASEYIFLIFGTPVGPYYKGGLKPVKALVVEQFDRAAPMGVGDCKVGGNYAAGLRGEAFGHDQGYSVVLYLDPREKKNIDEFSTSNFIGIKGNTYITPSSPSILKSITNKSLAQIAEDLGMKVERRDIAIDEVESFDEVGAVGTAAVITPIHKINYRGKDMVFCDEQTPGSQLTKLYNRLTQIQTGEYPDTHGWLHEIKIG